MIKIVGILVFLPLSLSLPFLLMTKSNIGSNAFFYDEKEKRLRPAADASCRSMIDETTMVELLSSNH